MPQKSLTHLVSNRLASLSNKIKKNNLDFMALGKAKANTPVYLNLFHKITTESNPHQSQVL